MTKKIYTNEGKTLYISDLDDTLLNKDSVLSEYTKNSLNKLISNGINFTVATGRTTDAVQKIMADVELRIPIASFNGVVIYDIKQKHCVKIYRIATGTVKQIVTILKSHVASWLVYTLEENELIAYYESLEHTLIHDFVKDRKMRYNSTFCQVKDQGDVPPEHIIYFTLIDTYDHIKPVYDALSKIPNINLSMVDDTNIGGFWWLEIFSSEASKENTVMFLRDAYGYSRIVGFGDNYNDLPMFKVCDVRVAVKNALDGIKNAADCICESNDKDGVVKWIFNHIGSRYLEIAIQLDMKYRQDVIDELNNQGMSFQE